MIKAYLYQLIYQNVIILINWDFVTHHIKLSHSFFLYSELIWVVSYRMSPICIFKNPTQAIYISNGWYFKCWQLHLEMMIEILNKQIFMKTSSPASILYINFLFEIKVNYKRTLLNSIYFRLLVLSQWKKLNYHIPNHAI